MSLSPGDLEDRRHGPAGFAGSGRTKPRPKRAVNVAQPEGTSPDAGRSGARSLAAHATGHLTRVTSLAAAALVAALCLPAGQAHPDTVEPRQPTAKEHIVPSAARSTR